MIQHPNKYHKLNPALFKLALGKGAGNGGGGNVLPSPIHFWPMNEGSGTTFVDHAGSTNLATSAITWATATGMGSNPVAQFNTSAFGYASAVDPTLNFNGTTPFSVSLWFNTPVATPQSYCGNLTPSTDQGWEFTTGGASGQGLGLVNNIGTSDDIFYLNGTPQSTNVATFVTITYDGLNTPTSAKLYINGGLSPVTASGTLATPGFSSSAAFIVGIRNGGANGFQGAMAFLRVWNTTLRATQVAALAALGPQ